MAKPNPPCTITPKILNLVADISILLGCYKGLHSPTPGLKLRRQNRIKTIAGSLQIEGNSFCIEQMTAILEGKRVLGPVSEIREIQNAVEAYQNLKKFDPYSLKSFCKCHGILMDRIINEAGRLRSGNVGILKGTKVSHVAPKASMVYELMENLFSFLKKNKDLHFLILSSIAHYEIEFIHPFSDGNGRIGRLWQTLILTKNNPLFEYLPIESSIKNHQKKYYDALEKSDKSGESSPFVEFILEMIKLSLEEFLSTIKNVKLTTEDRLSKAKEHFVKTTFSRIEYLSFFKDISPPTASRDLQWGVKNGILKKEGDKRLSVYRFRR